MEGRGRNFHRRSKNRRPPRAHQWQPSIPAWEKEFCKEVGLIKWKTFLTLKAYVHMYHKVTEWDDSAGKEAFINAKRRYWAKKNGLSCNTPPPDPDLYIDQINWDSDTNLDYDYILYSDVGTLPKIEENHESVVIFGDCFKPNQDLVTVGWGDIDEGKFASPPTYPLANYVNPWAHNEWAPAAWQPVYSNDAWQGYTNDAWQGYNNGTGHAYMPWEGDWSHWNTWDYATYCWYNYSGQEIRGTWNENNATMNVPGGYMSSY